jgi:hypothetical protein
MLEVGHDHHGEDKENEEKDHADLHEELSLQELVVDDAHDGGSAEEVLVNFALLEDQLSQILVIVMGFVLLDLVLGPDGGEVQVGVNYFLLFTRVVLLALLINLCQY